MSPEFSRPERVDAIGSAERVVEIGADADERRRLAGRFGLIEIGQLEARFSLHRGEAEIGIVVRGRVTAALVQACAVTGDPLPVTVAEDVGLRFVESIDGAEEIELGADALDTLPIEDGEIDLGEIAAETMALALDPFARVPDADEALRAAGVKSEDEAGTGAFGALAALRKQLE